MNKDEITNEELDQASDIEETPVEQIDEPVAAIDTRDQRIAELTNDLQRTRADFENYRRQVEVQKEQHANFAKYATIKKILPLFDDIDRAIVANPDTLAPLAKNIEKTLKSVGLTKIESEPGTDFNPDLHEAISVDGDGDVEKVSESLRTGYYYENEVIRPAMVKVAKS